jgi:hypothetical protein
MLQTLSRCGKLENDRASSARRRQERTLDEYELLGEREEHRALWAIRKTKYNETRRKRTKKIQFLVRSGSADPEQSLRANAVLDAGAVRAKDYRKRVRERGTLDAVARLS